MYTTIPIKYSIEVKCQNNIGTHLYKAGGTRYLILKNKNISLQIIKPHESTGPSNLLFRRRCL